MSKKSKFTHPMWSAISKGGQCCLWVKICKVWKGFLSSISLWTDAVQPPAECSVLTLSPPALAAVPDPDWDQQTFLWEAPGLSQTDPGQTTHDKLRRKSSSENEQHPSANFRLPAPILQFRELISVPCLTALFPACLPLCCCFLPTPLPKELLCLHFSYSVFLLYLLTASDVINSVNKNGRHRQRGR